MMLCLVGIILTCLHSTFSQLLANDVHFKTRKDYRIKEDDWMVPGKQARSRIECVNQCLYHDQCLSAAFGPGNECYVSTKDTINDAMDLDLPRSIEYALGWVTMSKIQFPVMHLTEGSKWTLTFEQAKDACIAYGTSLASPQDLRQARNLGMDLCFCSWLSDGKKYIAIRQYYEWCLNSYTDDIINCDGSRELGDAWCLVV